MEYGEKTKKKKYWKMRHKHCDTCHMARNTEKSAKCETHTLGPGIWQGTVKNVKNEKYTP